MQIILIWLRTFLDPSQLSQLVSILNAVISTCDDASPHLLFKCGQCGRLMLNASEVIAPDDRLLASVR